jgi:tRNA-splicing ligase RtcB
MLFVKSGNTRLPIFSWCADVEPKAMEQAMNLANHPVTVHHVALMPDCHSGYGMPIGGVVACEGAVIPNAVGVDIGCGMRAARLHAGPMNTDDVRAVLEGIKRRVPVGFDHHESPQEWGGFDNAPDVEAVREESESARYQLGTLGGGNHFIEIQQGSDGYIWAMVHSGSRHLGLMIAKHYVATASKLCERWHVSLPPGKGDDSLAFLPIGTPEAKDYIDAMQFALAFARENRARIMDVVISEFIDVLGFCGHANSYDVHHNYAQIENHFGRNVWVHRKGATSAKLGEIGIIPGSMGTTSYIVRGLGNKNSFESCSHGAGRASGRAEFNRTHTVEECRESMKGVVFSGWDDITDGKDRYGRPVDLSEAPAAYKPIERVMADQADLVEAIVKLTPLGVVKG